ncbi:MAG: hypothetical protein H0W39_03065 [Sphingomonas sp.]|nr:hypothetical protein [Sphingomonas sp.]
MRRTLIVSASFALAACATTPRVATTTPDQPPPSEHTRGAIIGLTSAQLVQRFGTPALQIREGESLKLQFRGPFCVLDAYLYATGTAPHRVTYVDTRNRALADVDQDRCIDSMGAP